MKHRGGEAIVAAALADQRRTTEAVNREMRRCLAKAPDLNDWHEDKIAKLFPHLVKLMMKAARAEARAVQITSKAAARLSEENPT